MIIEQIIVLPECSIGASQTELLFEISVNRIESVDTNIPSAALPLLNNETASE